jgi:hypothetical protein
MDRDAALRQETAEAIGLDQSVIDILLKKFGPMFLSFMKALFRKRSTERVARSFSAADELEQFKACCDEAAEAK